MWWERGAHRDMVQQCMQGNKLLKPIKEIDEMPPGENFDYLRPKGTRHSFDRD